jgi:hypothetical protein
MLSHTQNMPNARLSPLLMLSMPSNARVEPSTASVDKRLRYIISRLSAPRCLCLTHLMAWLRHICFWLGCGSMGHGNCNGFVLNVYDSGNLVYHTG